MALWLTLFLALLLNGAAAYAAHRKDAVSADGAVAGLLVGSALFVGVGFLGWLLLMWFFASSSAIGRLMTDTKRRAERIHEKGGRRDWFQVCANGGPAAVAALCHGLTGSAIAFLATAVAIASATADTWASEVGALSSHRPRSIVTFQPLPTGTSGGITILGTIAALGGSASIALIFLLGAPESVTRSLASSPVGSIWAAALLVCVAGFFGSVVDSVLGATVQAQYEDGSGLRTEKSHGNRLVRGARLVTNDVVNVVSGTLVTAASVVVLY